MGYEGMHDVVKGSHALQSTARLQDMAPVDESIAELMSLVWPHSNLDFAAQKATMAHACRHCFAHHGNDTSLLSGIFSLGTARHSALAMAAWLDGCCPMVTLQRVHGSGDHMSCKHHGPAAAGCFPESACSPVLGVAQVHEIRYNRQGGFESVSKVMDLKVSSEVSPVHEEGPMAC